jgi:hypothetical protein
VALAPHGTWRASIMVGNSLLGAISAFMLLSHLRLSSTARAVASLYVLALAARAVLPQDCHSGWWYAFHILMVTKLALVSEGARPNAPALGVSGAIGDMVSFVRRGLPSVPAQGR